MAMLLVLSPPAARLAPLLRRLNPTPSLLRHLALPQRARASTSPSRAMSPVPNLRLPSSWDSADDPLDFSAVAGVFFPLRRRTTKRKRAASPEFVEVRAAADKRAGGAAEVGEKAPAAKKGNLNSHLDKKTVKIMTYNVWFREDLELTRRMNAIGALIQQHSPDLICFQMSKLPVKSFDRKLFSDTYMGRELCTADVIVGGLINLVVATSHLESPCPGPPTWDQMFSKERVSQADEALRTLGAFRNVVFCGDMNWDDKGDGPFPLPDGWIDPWTELKPGEDGLTYDTKANVMLSANRKLQKRLDRFVCKLSDFKVESIEMIGKEAIPGITYIKEKKVRQETRQLVLPVFPSDHFGLVLTISNQV
nr:unnamed protein product [Digitaria exilis]